MRGAEARHPLWDLPVRLSHWVITLCLPAAWWTAEEGLLELHAWIGYTVLTLVLARLAPLAADSLWHLLPLEAQDGAIDGAVAAAPLDRSTGTEHRECPRPWTVSRSLD